jgi:hypothetical protein
MLRSSRIETNLGLFTDNLRILFEWMRFEELRKTSLFKDALIKNT